MEDGGVKRRYRAPNHGSKVALRVPYGCMLDVESLTLGGEADELGFGTRQFDTTPEPFEIVVSGLAPGARRLARLPALDQADGYS